jgi:hypothetical protein
MYNDFIEILKGWRGEAQFIFLFLLIFTILGSMLVVIKYIGEFFTETLAVLARGWPPRNEDVDKEKDSTE